MGTIRPVKRLYCRATHFRPSAGVAMNKVLVSFAAVACHALCFCTLSRGDLAQAEEYAERALELVRRLGARRFESEALGFLGDVRWHAPQLSPEGRSDQGLDYWSAFLEEPPVSFLECTRQP